MVIARAVTLIAAIVHSLAIYLASIQSKSGQLPVLHLINHHCHKASAICISIEEPIELRLNAIITKQNHHLAYIIINQPILWRLLIDMQTHISAHYPVNK